MKNVRARTPTLGDVGQRCYSKATTGAGSAGRVLFARHRAADPPAFIYRIDAVIRQAGAGGVGGPLAVYRAVNVVPDDKLFEKRDTDDAAAALEVGWPATGAQGTEAAHPLLVMGGAPLAGNSRSRFFSWCALDCEDMIVLRGDEGLQFWQLVTAGTLIELFETTVHWREG